MGGRCQILFFRKTILSHFMFSLRFMLFPTFFRINKNLLLGGGGCLFLILCFVRVNKAK